MAYDLYTSSEPMFEIRNFFRVTGHEFFAQSGFVGICSLSSNRSILKLRLILSYNMHKNVTILLYF